MVDGHPGTIVCPRKTGTACKLLHRRLRGVAAVHAGATVQVCIISVSRVVPASSSCREVVVRKRLERRSHSVARLGAMRGVAAVMSTRMEGRGVRVGAAVGGGDFGAIHVVGGLPVDGIETLVKLA